MMINIVYFGRSLLFGGYGEGPRVLFSRTVDIIAVFGGNTVPLGSVWVFVVVDRIEYSVVRASVVLSCMFETEGDVDTTLSK